MPTNLAVVCKLSPVPVRRRSGLRCPHGACALRNNEPLWILLYFYFPINQKPKSAPLLVFRNFCLYTLQNAMKRGDHRSEDDRAPCDMSSDTACDSSIRGCSSLTCLSLQTRHETPRPCHRSSGWRQSAPRDCAVLTPEVVYENRNRRCRHKARGYVTELR